VDTYLRDGFDDVLAKPFTQAQLAAIILKHCRPMRDSPAR
jgi:CheY-like chemotaxis protein